MIEEIGRGGMGVVYRAEDMRLGRTVALKALPSAVAMHPELRQRLRREARAAATISHPSVAVVYALEEMDDHLFIASEYVRGETLRSEIARGPIAPERARAIAADIAGALAAAHEAGVIHRDLKPENVLIKPDGGVKVVDFGIAQIEGPEATRLTRTGSMLGTPAYMAPEQLLGETVDGRADIYALGIVLSEMLTGRHPLQGRGAGRNVHLTGPFGTIIGRCLNADPANRYESARDLAAELGSGPLQRTDVKGLSRFVKAGLTPNRFWWEFHEAATAVVYSVMVIPAWYARGQIGGWQGRAFFIAPARDGGRGDDGAAAPLVHVTLLSVRTGLGPSAIEPMDPRCRLGVRRRRWRSVGCSSATKARRSPSSFPQSPWAPSSRSC